MALYLEGPTDERFLVPLIQRGLEERIQGVEILDPLVFLESEDRGGERDREARIFEAARRSGADLFVVHADANARSPDRARVERIEPGFVRIRDGWPSDEPPPALVPLIPVRETEAWMLADRETLAEVLGVDRRRLEQIWRELGLPSTPRGVERISDPKVTLDRLLDALGSPLKRGDLYALLGQSLSLDSLRPLPSGDRFLRELEEALVRLGLLRKD